MPFLLKLLFLPVCGKLNLLITSQIAMVPQPIYCALAMLLALAPLAHANTHEVVRTLAELTGSDNPIHLRGAHTAATVKIPFSPRENVTDAVLTLHTTNSTALIRARSSLTVRANTAILGQFTLDPEKTRAERVLKLPAGTLSAGYNDLTFGAEQHYTYECEDAGSPELWTEIDTRNSTLKLNFKGYRVNDRPRLTQLHVLFDERSLMEREVGLVSAADRQSNAHLSAVSLIAQGVALYSKHRPTNFKFFPAEAALALSPQPSRLTGLSTHVGTGRDVVLFGTRAQIARFVDPEIAQSITGPYLGIFTLPDGVSAAVVVSGITEREMVRAAQAFADPGFKHSDVATEIVTEVASARPPELPYGEATGFYRFGYSTSTARGSRAGPIGVPVRLPGDFVGRKDRNITLSLHYSHGAGLRQDSSVSITVGGELVSSIRLSATEGAEYPKHKVTIPTTMFRPGLNWIVFEPVLISSAGRCEPRRDDGLAFSLFEDSTIELSGSLTQPMVPDLSRLPTARWPYTERATVWIARADSATVQAFAQLSALMARSMTSLFEPVVTDQLPAEGDFMVVGRYGELPEEVLARLPLNKYAWSPEGHEAAMLQVADPKGVMTVFTAADSHTLDRAAEVLRTKHLWGQLAGEAAVIDIKNGELRTQAPSAPVPYRREIGYRATLESYLGSSSLVLLVVISVGLFSAAVASLLRRKAKSRLISTGTPE